MKMNVDDAALTLAASVVDRTCELLSDGWVKGKLYDGPNGVEGFCIHGALNLAIEEVFGPGTSVGRHHIDGTRMLTTGASDIEAIAVAFIVDEAATQFKYEGGRSLYLGAAGFNDAEERKLEHVLSVVGSAGKRLWDIAMDSETSAVAEVSWAAIEEEATQQFMYASLN